MFLCTAYQINWNAIWCKSNMFFSTAHYLVNTDAPNDELRLRRVWLNLVFL